MKRLSILALVGALFLSVPLLTPRTAVAHPGNSCNPPAGHGRPGCHRSTTRKVVAARPAAARVTPASKKRAVAPAVETYPPITDAELGAAFFGTQPGYGGRGDR